MVKFNRVDYEIRERTDKQTDAHLRDYERSSDFVKKLEKIRIK